jgi:polar amino acid transport system substrate-binding protein
LLVAAQLGETVQSAPSNALRWGADRTGGAPYVYDGEDGGLTGFEADLADYLGEQLGRQPWFVQGTWEKLPFQLNRNDIDVVLNGYEWTPDREREWASTIPYYYYSLNLLVHRDNDTTQTWEDLRRLPGGKRPRVGVLKNTAAHKFLQRQYGDDIRIEAYSEGVTSAMQLVVNKSLDATVQDFPAVRYYCEKDEDGDFHDKLRIVEPDRIVGGGYYVMYVRRDQLKLRDKLNQAIKQAIENGKLREICEREQYDIWTPGQEAALARAADEWPSKTAAALAETNSGLTTDLGKNLTILARAAVTTVLLACISMPLAMAIGLLVAVGRMYGPTFLAKVLAAYVEVLRGTPLLMQLYVIYFVLPEANIKLDPFWAGVMGLAINYSAYESENYRAGLLAVPYGQMEAALALGMSRWTALHRIIIPQAVRIVIPPVTNDFIALFKDTSVCSVIAVTELTGRYSEIANDHPSLILQVGILTAILYLLMSYPLSILARRLEHKYPRVVV